MSKYAHNHFNPSLKEYARELRTETVSNAEKYLWKGLLSRKQTVEHFLRQRPIQKFIVDFFAPEFGLIIEIDGNSHYAKPDYDRYREDKLVSLGYTFMRFKEGDVLNNLNAVNEQILHAIHVLRNTNKS
jgi:very-short-patch-repair endonuclease